MVDSRKIFFRMFAVLTVSLALQNLLTYSVNLVDNIMLGAYSETALSGAALCNQFQFLLQMLVMGTGEGVVVLGSQYWGKNNLKPISHIIGVALRYGMAMSAVMFVVVLFFPAQVLGLLTNDRAVIAEGVAYLKIICFTYVIFTATNILTASLRAIGIVKIGYIISASTLCINIVLNYCLIYGNLGAPQIGIRGAAVATLVSRCAEFVIVVFYLKYREKRLNLNLRKLVFIDKSYYRDYRKVAFPVLLNQAQWGVAQMVQTGILGHMGAAAIAANSIATIVFQIISVVVYGSSSATSILVGKTIGEGREDRLHEMVSTMKKLFIGIGIVTGVLIFAVRIPVLMIYNISDEARNLAMQFIAVMAVTTVGTAYQVPCDNGIIRGGGDTSFSMKINFVSMWMIVVPFSALAAFVFHCPPVVVFFLLKWDQIYKVFPVTLRLNSWKWVKHVTRVSEAPSRCTH